MRAIIITGAPGAGKSSALTALTDRLGDEGVEHVAVEVDELSRGFPWRDGRRHLPALAAGADLLLVAATVESPDYLRDLLTALGRPDHLLVVLHARPETLVRRVRERETIPWSGLEALIDRTPALQEAVLALPQADLTLDTETATPVAVAAAILAAWQLRGRRGSPDPHP
jgi:RNase adaptor protein for sRNA GlmZ degradation